MSPWLLHAIAGALCFCGALLLGLPIAGIVGQLRRPARIAAQQLALALLLPGLGAALWAGSSAKAGVPPWPQLWPLVSAVGGVPLLLLPVLFRLAHLLDGQKRAASGLGAGRVARLRLVWLPQLGPALLLGAVLAATLEAGAALLAG